MPRWPAVDHSNTHMTQATERAWAAGLFDGEGSTCPRRPRAGSKACGVRMVLSQKNTGPGILLRLQATLQVGHVSERTDRPGVWVWRCSVQADCLFALKSMWSFLSEPKRDQASKLLNEVELNYVPA